jgi:hypothetical protein
VRAQPPSPLIFRNRAPRAFTPPDIDPPTCFNTGCCCFLYRDVTGLEIAGGKVTLLRCFNDEGGAAQELAPPIPLTELFARLRAAA